jgi:hypothetical protein
MMWRSPSLEPGPSRRERVEDEDQGARRDGNGPPDLGGGVTFSCRPDEAPIVMERGRIGKRRCAPSGNNCRLVTLGGIAYNLVVV